MHLLRDRVLEQVVTYCIHQGWGLGHELAALDVVNEVCDVVNEVCDVVNETRDVVREVVSSHLSWETLCKVHQNILFLWHFMQDTN